MLFLFYTEESANNCAKETAGEIVHHGTGWNHCQGSFDYWWVETSKDPVVYLSQMMESYTTVTVYFRNTTDRERFLRDNPKNDNIKVTKKGKIKITNIGYFFDAIIML